MSDNLCKRTNKTRYVSKKDATSAIFELRLRSFTNSGRGGQGRQVKRCNHCGGFHVMMAGKATRS